MTCKPAVMICKKAKTPGGGLGCSVCGCDVILTPKSKEAAARLDAELLCVECATVAGIMPTTAQDALKMIAPEQLPELLRFLVERDT